MTAPFGLLYQNAMENFNDTLRMLDPDELSHYNECTAALSRQAQELAGLLGQERMEKYTDVLAEREILVEQAIFRRGLALGLRLGALAVL